MSERRKLLSAWQASAAAQEEVAVATVVRVHGSSYRKAGARMLVSRTGQRTGMVSGGCLEAEVSRKIWWLTEHGPAIRKYQTSFDEDGNATYGLGCGGSVDLLLERGENAVPVLEALRSSVEERQRRFVYTVLSSQHPGISVGTHVSSGSERLPESVPSVISGSRERLSEVLSELTLLAGTHAINIDGHVVELLAEDFSPPLRLFVFGAGDDAQPLVEFAFIMGWDVIVAEGRSHLLTRDRFPLASHRILLDREVAGDQLHVEPQDAAVILTHSFQQDSEVLRRLLPLRLAYLGILGPSHRTLQLLEQVAPQMRLSVEDCLARLHAPVGLDIGADAPAGIALSIVAEIHAAIHMRTAASLRDVHPIAVPVHV